MPPTPPSVRAVDRVLTQQAEKGFGAGFRTPLVTINGQQSTGDLYTPGPLEQAIRSAQG